MANAGDSSDRLRSSDVSRLSEEIQKARDRAAKGATSKGARVDELAADVLFLSLLSRTLLQIMLDTRLTTVEYITARMRQLDMLDGEPDGGLPTDIVARELGMPKPQVDRKKAFARSVKKTRKKTR